MAHLHKQELICPACHGTRDLPFCCGREMEHDNLVFFCPYCGKELLPLRCCNREMEFHTIVRDIRKELFGKI